MSLMQSTRPLDPWRWLGVPALACVVATIVFAIPIKVFGLLLPEPVFPMVLAFAWAVIRPSVIAPFVLMLLGLFLDVFWGGPMGLWGVSLLASYTVVLASRSIMTGQSRPMRQVWFAGATGLTMLTGFLISSVISLALPNLLAVFWQFLATALLYPFAHRLIERFEDADVRFR
jgi:rod shape-determining protein MreD